MADVPWHLSGDYFENCSCSIVCPCLVSAAAPLTSRPTEGFCNVPLIFHIESGRYGDIALDGFVFFVGGRCCQGHERASEKGKEPQMVHERFDTSPSIIEDLIGNGQSRGDAMGIKRWPP